MMRSPNWKSEELKLALELYLSKDLEWLSHMTDSTEEIIQLSKLLNCLDFYKEDKPNNFRSTGSIRMKLSNFKALDSRYEKMSLSNVSSLDKAIFREYNERVELLREECRNIVDTHVFGELPIELISYVDRFGKRKNISEEFKDFICDIHNKAFALRKRAVDIKDIEYSQKIMNICYEIITITSKCNFVKKNDNFVENKSFEKSTLVLVKNYKDKVGKYVQCSMQYLIKNDLLDGDIILDMMDEKWSKKVLNLRYPFLVKIVSEEDIKKQITDKNGYVRYWTKPYFIKGEKYCICKEWVEENRMYFDKLLIQLESSMKFEMSSEDLRTLIKYIQKIDEKVVSISREELKNQIDDKYNKENVVNKLISIGVLREFQGSQRELVIEDYEIVFQILDTPDKFVI